MSQTVKEVAVTIMTKMDNLPPVSTECCIYRVPEKFRRLSFFIRNHCVEHRDENYEIFSKQWMGNGVFHDVLLLENQVPFFVLENLYNLTVLRTTVTFFKLSYEYFKYALHGHELAGTRSQVLHLVDYVRAPQLPSFPRGMMSKQAKKFELTRSAKELHEVGVKFRQAEGTSSVLDVIFRDGTLVMPHLVVHEWTEVYFRNMIAYEQCHHDYNYISSYAVLMDRPIDTPKDIDILIRRGMLENQLGSTEDVASLVKGMYKETVFFVLDSNGQTFFCVHKIIMLHISLGSKPDFSEDSKKEERILYLESQLCRFFRYFLNWLRHKAS
ncbi:hypothetical protein NL676_035256 [Syzygium grande]|nr:hypothetical protein NL676_035256 [Syzygium grande]